MFPKSSSPPPLFDGRVLLAHMIVSVFPSRSNNARTWTFLKFIPLCIPFPFLLLCGISPEQERRPSCWKVFSFNGHAPSDTSSRVFLRCHLWFRGRVRFITGEGASVPELRSLRVRAFSTRRVSACAKRSPPDLFCSDPPSPPPMILGDS